MEITLTLAVPSAMSAALIVACALFMVVLLVKDCFDEDQFTFLHLFFAYSGIACTRS